LRDLVDCYAIDRYQDWVENIPGIVTDARKLIAPEQADAERKLRADQLAWAIREPDGHFRLQLYATAEDAKMYKGWMERDAEGVMRGPGANCGVYPVVISVAPNDDERKLLAGEEEQFNSWFGPPDPTPQKLYFYEYRPDPAPREAFPNNTEENILRHLNASRAERGLPPTDSGEPRPEVPEPTTSLLPPSMRKLKSDPQSIEGLIERASAYTNEDHSHCILIRDLADALQRLSTEFGTQIEAARSFELHLIEMRKKTSAF
ncbi:MAG: hypothetical protein ACRD3W_13510, partial [Terriglobales bacterium]